MKGAAKPDKGGHTSQTGRSATPRPCRCSKHPPTPEFLSTQFTTNHPTPPPRPFPFNLQACDGLPTRQGLQCSRSVLLFRLSASGTAHKHAAAPPTPLALMPVAKPQTPTMRANLSWPTFHGKHWMRMPKCHVCECCNQFHGGGALGGATRQDTNRGILIRDAFSACHSYSP